MNDQESVQEKSKKLLHERIKTKVWKGKYAPIGRVSYVVRLKVKKQVFTNSIRMNCDGVNEEKEQVLFDELYDQIIKIYKLEILSA